MSIYAPDAVKMMCEWLDRHAASKIKELLESKHLYQKVELDADALAAESRRVYDLVSLGNRDNFASWVNKLPQQRLVPLYSEMSPSLRLAANITESTPTLSLPNVALFCKKCGRREAFSPVWHTDVASEIVTAVAAGVSKKIVLPNAFQILLLLYRCQRCLGIPESFLIERTASLFKLQGRSPMEEVETPKYLPKKEVAYYSDAIIAFNSGKTLAALFYLRTFIEQFGRRITGITARATGDEIFDPYSNTLPPTLRDQMPSLRNAYEKLSEALHAARADEAVFESVRKDIEKHFEIRKVFDVPEVGASPVKDTTGSKDKAKPA